MQHRNECAAIRAGVWIPRRPQRRCDSISCDGHDRPRNDSLVRRPENVRNGHGFEPGILHQRGSAGLRIAF